MTLIDDYLLEQQNYEKKYGVNTIVLMQVGHFYECYGVGNKEEQINNKNLYKLGDILNIQITRKNKSIIENSRKNPIMIGVPIFTIDKYVQMLLNYSYTIVVIDQTGKPPFLERAVTNIYSPGTNIEYVSNGDTNNLMSVYIESTKSSTYEKELMFVGISVIDLSTGKNTIYETYSNFNDKNYALDEVFRCVQTYDPKEILIITKNLQTKNEKLINYLDLSHRVTHIMDLDDTIEYRDNKEKLNITYQNTLLKKIFPETGLLSVIEYLDLENKIFATISYIFLLAFAYEHNSTIINKIEKPELWNESKYLSLTNNCINQLNVVGNPSLNINTKFNSLFAVINNTSTPIGKRLLRERLLNPIIDPIELEKRYDYIESFLVCDRQNTNTKCVTNTNTNYLYKNYEEYLNKVVDIEKLHRKLSLKILQPCDMSSLDYSYENITKLLSIKNSSIQDILPCEEDIQNFHSFIQEYTRDFNLDEIVKFHIDKINSSFFNRGVCCEIDEAEDNINHCRSTLKKIISKLSNLIDITQCNLVKLECTDRDGYYLSATAKRCTMMKGNIKKDKKGGFALKFGTNNFFSYSDLEFKSSKSNTRITNNTIREIATKLRSYEDQIGNLCREKFLERLEIYDSKYRPSLDAITRYIANIDLIKSCAKTSKLYAYTRPIIQHENENQKNSFISARELRHPIIERINTDTNYVPNDIELGGDLNGMLLFGTNASGKSSLMKAIGLNIIMAQAGFFVGSSKFVFAPYKYLFTRICNNDNIFKGESSFAVEMSELRSILKRGDKNSLILGDELCSGTESISALSIFSSSVIQLAKRGCHFVFATHLHELCKISRIMSLEKVAMFHLKVICDSETGELVYDRKLEKGSGPAIYGLEVCKAMDMDRDFILLAEELRKDLLDIPEKIVEDKPSHYNSEVYISDCSICGKKADDAHHIKFQCTADKDNVIDNYLIKDSKSNLVPLCKDCHNNVHRDVITINGYVQTSSGIKLDYQEKNQDEIKQMNQQKKNSKKISDDQQEIIKNLKTQNNRITQKQICQYMEKKHSLKISVGTVGKILKGNY